MIKNKPVLLPGLELYLQAFLDLNSERNHNFGLMRIPWSSIKNYADHYNFNEEQTENLFYFINRMDNANLKELSKKLPK